MAASPARGDLLDPVPAAVETTLFRALAALRLLLGVYAVALDLSRWREFEHPLAGWTVIALIAGWSLVAGWAYDSPRRRGRPLLVLDLLVAVTALASTRYVQSDAMLARHAATMPSFWVITAVLVWAVVLGWRGGLPVAVLVAAIDLSQHPEPNGTTWGNIFLMLLSAGVVGYSSTLVREATEARAEAERIAAVLSERARLARAVHDGVLQVLALVQRRGGELGGEAAELGRLAGEQEAVLRGLVQGGATSPRAPGAAGDEADLVAGLTRFASSTVTVSGPGDVVLLPGHVVEELTVVVRACLDNVARHVGSQAPAWVLVERLPDRVVLSVRDEGPGIEPGRLPQAAAEGRLGVRESIQGRLADLGGTAELTTAAGRGTEWELTVPVVDGRLRVRADG